MSKKTKIVRYFTEGDKEDIQDFDHIILVDLENAEESAIECCREAGPHYVYKVTIEPIYLYTEQPPKKEIL